MGFLDRLLGREEAQYPTAQYQANQPRTSAAQPQRSDDEIAVERYQYLLRTAPPETIEKVHTEAFSKLTPQQRDILFAKLTENADASERPANAQPETLAKAATRQELQQPGTMTRAFGGGYGGGNGGGPSFGSMVGSSILGTVAGYVIGSALVSTFFPSDFGNTSADSSNDSSGDNSNGDGTDSSNADSSNSDSSTDASADSASADTSYADGGGYDSSGWGGGDSGGFDSGGDFGGGGDFGF